MVHGPAVEIKEERAGAPLPRASIGNLRKEDVIKVYHPTTARWKSVVVKQIRVRSCRIQVCSENEASSSYDKAPGDSLEWLDFSQLRFKMMRKIGASRSLHMDEEGYTQPHGEPREKACVTAPDTAGKRTHKIQRGGSLEASVPAPSLKRKKRKKIQKKRSFKALRSATDSEDQNRDSQLASSPSPAHSSQTSQEGKDKGDMTEAEAVAVAGTDGEVSSNPKVVLGVPINTTKKKYMRIVGGHLREADECAVLPPLTPDLTDPEKPLKRAFSHHGDLLSKRCRRLLDFDKTFCEQLCGEIEGAGEEGMANVSGPDHQKFHFNSSNEHFEGVTVKSVLREIFDLKGQTSSVAHMKESESKQKGKADLYEPLPHIMYRLTYINAESPMTLRTATCLEDCLFPCIACVVATKDAKEAREYILWPNQRLEVLRNPEADACHFQALSVNQLQKHMVDNSCLIVHYQYDQGTLLRACTTEHSIPKSNVQVMMHTKKSSTNSTEINKLATTVSKQMKVSSLGIRLDLFISPDLKSTLGKEELSALTAVVRGFECQLKLAILNWNLETSLAYLTALEEKYESSRSASACSLAAISTGENRGGIPSKDLINHTRNSSWSALNSCSKRILLKTFIDRTHRLGRKVGSLDCDDILAKIRNSDGLLDFIGRNKTFFSKRVLYYISSMLQLMSIDMILTKETNSGHYLFRQFHILNRSNSRDSFTYELVTKKTICRLAKGTDYVRTEYFFPPDAIPDNYRDVVPKSCYDDNLGIYPAGVTTCTDLFSERELGEIEEKILDLERRIAMQILPETCYDQSVNRNWIKRTKTFFGARYLWTKDQTSDQDAGRAAGIRVDVPKVPKWVRHHVEEPLVECGVIPENFVNSSAINIYHDGSEGIQSHYDDDKRFSRPIVSLRTCSDSRLSFGTQFFGYVNGSFFVPMPRGGVTVMEENGYAANGIKHSVRPTDMVGKSVAIILRHIHETNLREAQDIFVEESLSWLKDLGLEETSRETNRAVDATLSSVMESIIKRVEKEDERQRKEEERQRKEDERQRKREERERKNVQKVIERFVRECVKSAKTAVREEERQKKREEREQKAIQRTVKSIIRSVEKEVSIQRQVRNVLGDVIKGVVKQAKDA